MIRFEQVSKVFPGDFVGLDNISLQIPDGEFVSVVGRSGSGKSTLMKMIYAEERPSQGMVYFYNTLINNIHTKHLPYFRRNIGTVFQDFKLLPDKTVFENVAYALEVYGRSNEDIMEEVPQILEIVGLREKMDKFPYQLSGGEQQKTSLARALINRPRLIVADEPTGNLDPESTWEIIDLLLKINDFGTTILLATHDKTVVDEINRRVVVMSGGKVIRDDASGKYELYESTPQAKANVPDVQAVEEEVLVDIATNQPNDMTDSPESAQESK